MLNIKNRRDPRRFWEHAWTIHLQQPKDGKFNQEDLRWSMYEGVKFAWIRYDRLEDFVKGEEENEIAPTKMNVKLKNQQRWNENSRQKCNSYIERKQYTCQYGPEKTTVLKDIIGRKRKRFGKKTGCQYHFISCRMRANDQLCCILMQVGEHIDVDGKYCHGRLGPPTDKRCHHVMFLSKELREAFAEMMRHGMSPDGVFDKYIADLLSNKDEKQFPLQTSRDEYVSRKDLLNIYANVTEEGYKLNTDDRESTRLWVENFKHFFFLFQQEDKVNDVPLIIGVQSKWMLDNMVRFSKDSIISMDSTFNTNKYKYTLHTCMVFDSHYNGLPVAWVISSRTRTSDVELWLDLLVRRCRSVDSSWKVNAFLTDDSSVEIGAIRYDAQVQIPNSVHHGQVL